MLLYNKFWYRTGMFNIKRQLSSLWNPPPQQSVVVYYQSDWEVKQRGETRRRLLSVLEFIILNNVNNFNLCWSWVFWDTMHCNHSKSFHHNLISIQDRVQHPAVLQSCCSLAALSTHPVHRWGLWRLWGDTGRLGHCPWLQYNIHHGHTQYHGRWRPAHHLPTEGAFSRAWSVILCTFDEHILMKILQE